MVSTPHNDQQAPADIPLDSGLQERPEVQCAEPGESLSKQPSQQRERPPLQTLPLDHEPRGSAAECSSV